MMGDIISERWAGSNRNGGRHHRGMPGAITPESALPIDLPINGKKSSEGNQ
jgi:hypothetical protein